MTVARALTNTFSGIRPADVPAFVGAQLVGALLALRLMSWLLVVSRPAVAQVEGLPKGTEAPFAGLD